jgi:hypothetical protein
MSGSGSEFKISDLKFRNALSGSFRASLFHVRVLRGWRAAGCYDLLERPLRGGLLDGGAGDQEEPVITVVEVEHHLPARSKDCGKRGLFHAGIVGLFADVGKERVALLAAIWILEVVAKFERVVEVETNRFVDQLGQRIE